MTEQKYQSKLISELESYGFYVLKLEKTNKNGIPDLLALKDGERPLFIEVKGPKGRVSELQKFRLQELKSKGFDAHLTFSGDGFVEKLSQQFAGKIKSKENKFIYLQKPF